MRPIFVLILISLTMFTSTASAQDSVVSAALPTDSTTCLKELGWTFKLPAGFKIIDTAMLREERQEHNNENNWKNRPTGSRYDTTIFWARTPAVEVISVRFIDSVDYKKLIIINSSWRMQDEEVTVADVYFGAVKFHKYRDMFKTHPLPNIHAYFRTGYRGKIFTIEYVVSDTSMEEKIEKMLRASAFAR